MKSKAVFLFVLILLFISIASASASEMSHVGISDSHLDDSIKAYSSDNFLINDENNSILLSNDPIDTDVSNIVNESLKTNNVNASLSAKLSKLVDDSKSNLNNKNKIVAANSTKNTKNTKNNIVTANSTKNTKNTKNKKNYKKILNNSNIKKINNLKIFKKSKTAKVKEEAAGSFSELNNLIHRADSGYGAIFLHKDYVFTDSDSALKNGITIEFDGCLTIYGNNHTIDAKNLARIFNVYAGHVKIFDLIFKNGNAKEGGAIYSSSDECTAENCVFTKNTAADSGGAIFHVNANNCKFSYNEAMYGGAAYNSNINNSMLWENGRNSNRGGAMYGSTATNCIFTSNFSWNYGGAIFEGSAKNCTFISNYANYEGGAVCSCYINNCSFISNSAPYGGAAFGGRIENSYFLSNSADYGGAIEYSEAYNCTFEKNHANHWGGALEHANATNCIFRENTANERGGAMDGGMYGSTAINCSFENNYAANDKDIYNTNAINCTFDSVSKRSLESIDYGRNSIKEKGNISLEYAIPIKTLLNQNSLVVLPFFRI